MILLANVNGLNATFKISFFIYFFGKYPIKPSKSQVVVNLWHGTPLKKLGNLEKGLEKTDYNFFTYVVASSSMRLPFLTKNKHSYLFCLNLSVP